MYVAFRLARALFLAAWFAASLVPALCRSRLDRDPQRWRRAVGRSLAAFCERCGPAATKCAQLAASRTDLLPPALTGSLARVQDQARPPTRRLVRRALRQAYGPAGMWPFTLPSDRPIASGSVAIVLEAQAPDGTALAIKLVRPGIRRQIEADLMCLSWLMRRLERLPPFRALPIARAFEHMVPMIAKQADMFEEARAHSRLLPSMAAGVEMPALRPELARATALAMEFRRGTHKFTDTVPAQTYRTGCRRLLHALYRMIFVHGFVHCDLHPGNVAFAADGTVILYDYGLAAELSHADRRILVQLFRAVADRDPRRLAQAILASALLIPGKLDRDSLEKEAALLLDRWAGRPSGGFLVASFVKDLFELQYRHDVRSSATFAAAIWALAAYEGLVRDRYPDLDFQEEARPFLVSNMIATLRLAASGGVRLAQ